MRYSIIIPTLNEEKLLPGLLGQLCDENLKEKYDYEIIISDGGSSDDTIKIAECADKLILHKKQRRQSISEGRNKGAEAASGKVFIFLNGDVRLSNTEKFFELIEKNFFNSRYSAMTFAVTIFPEERKFTDSMFMNFYNNYFYFLNLIGLGMGRGECQIIRKNIFKRFFGYDEKLFAGEDFDLFKRIRREEDILFERKFKIFESPRRYRKHGHWKIFFTWLSNSLAVMFLKKSFSKEWEEVR